MIPSATTPPVRSAASSAMPAHATPQAPCRALLCGLSTRAVSLFLEPLLAGRSAAGAAGIDLAKHLEIVGVIEPDAVRVAAFEARYKHKLHRFDPTQWDEALHTTRPDALLVTTPDHLHEGYIVRGLEAGLDIITEKPMVISTAEAKRVLAAENASKGSVRVAFNYRHQPLHERLKAFFDEGRLGRVIQVDFHYTLDTLHGASYFYRWNRERRHSGSLAVHKCCHSFDLVRWMIGQDPEEVTALGGLNYYGPESPHRPGGPLGNVACPYLSQWFTKGNAELPEDDHPIYHLQGDKGLPFPSQYPERLSLYDGAIDIEDNYSALIRFRQGARMTFSVNFSAPWEGYRMTVNGELGRLEVEFYVAPTRCPFPATSRATFLPLFGGEPEPLEWETASGNHSGGDPRMLKQLFAPDATTRLATARDGAVAVAMGEAIWRSAVEKRTIRLHDLPGAAAFLEGPSALPRKPHPNPPLPTLPGHLRRKAFSLLEAMVSVVIIAILAMLLTSGVQALRLQSRSMRCLGQLRTLWTGAMQFVQEHNGRFCSLNVEKSRRDPKSPGFREYVGYTANLFEDTLYSCPEAQRGELAAGGNMFRSYSVNRLMVHNWAPVDSGATIVNGALGYYNRVPSLAEAIYLVDGVPNPNSATSSGKGINYYTNVNASNVNSLEELHGGKLNAIYLDGHAATLRRADLERPKENVLWGGTERNP